MRRTVIALVVLLVAGGLGVGWVVTSEPDWYLRLRYPLRYSMDVREQARRYRLDPALVAAVIYQESRFDAGATSAAGAIGLMQLTPDTARAIAQRRAGTGTQLPGTSFTVADLRDPAVNVRYGSNYLRYLLDKYGGDVRAALAAYNAGETRVDGWVADGRLDPIPVSETRGYVAAVERARAVYRSAHGRALGPAP